MIRKLIAAAWILGSAATALIFAVFLFGCCVLPFHRVLHRAFPICRYLSGVLAGSHHADQPGAQAKPSTFLAKVLPARTEPFDIPKFSQALVLSRVAHDARALRNARSLGAVRVDDDIGLYTLLETFLI